MVISGFFNISCTVRANVITVSCNAHGSQVNEAIRVGLTSCSSRAPVVVGKCAVEAVDDEKEQVPKHRLLSAL